VGTTGNLIFLSYLSCWSDFNTLGGINQTFGVRRADPAPQLTSPVFSHEQPPSSVSTFMASPEEEIGVEKGRNESIRTIVSKLLDQCIHDKSMTPPRGLINPSPSRRLYFLAQLRLDSCRFPMTFTPCGKLQRLQMLSQTCASSSDSFPLYQWRHFGDQERIPALQISF